MLIEELQNNIELFEKKADLEKSNNDILRK